MFSELIRAGHDAAKLPHYTARQLNLYYSESQALNCGYRAQNIGDISAATHGGNAANSLLQTLDKLSK
ncbi:MULTISPECIES: hypothetical protein [unclassified Serratia (in: enterobacteria)]|uniref:hypothetical protein n=1 Tax=unclassified Serratia (in: enterobacteria) TaxID=2647522 RepID=UPI000467FDE2|nr:MULTISPECIES: hypothetical protein [unclassified Serratia (in: enterobacteria)]